MSIQKGHTYRIVVSDLVRHRPIWFGGTGSLGGEPGSVLRVAGAPEDRADSPGRHGHVEALSPRDQRATPRRPASCSTSSTSCAISATRSTRSASASTPACPGRQRRFIKGQKYTLLAHRENLTLDGRQALKTLLAANKRLNTAYLLKESFGQLWDYGREGWARRFFEHWRAALKWQRLEPYEKFAAMIERHWEGIAAYCHPENKVALGFVEGLNNKIRVLQRRAYGLRDEEYLRLKILTCMLPAL